MSSISSQVAPAYSIVGRSTVPEIAAQVALAAVDAPVAKVAESTLKTRKRTLESDIRSLSAKRWKLDLYCLLLKLNRKKSELADINERLKEIVREKRAEKNHPMPALEASTAPAVQRIAPTLYPAAVAHAEKLGWNHLKEDIFRTRKGTEFNLTNFITCMHQHDCSGILDYRVEGFKGRTDINERLISNPEEFDAVIALSEFVSTPEEVSRLKIAKANLIKLKETFLETFGFLRDTGRGKLLELMSLASAVLNHPLAFGAIDTDDTSDRAALLFEIKRYIDTEWPLNIKTGQGRNLKDLCWFPTFDLFNDPVKINQVQERYLEAGFALKFKKKEEKFSGLLMDQRSPNKIVQREPIQLPIRGFIEKCLRRPTDIDGVCINDEAPNYFMSLFPPGLYFVTTESDVGTFNERRQRLGGFASAVLTST
ncbi:MAG TPA: hypothetical protein VN457_06985 [Chlamydiales bacterium]|nr:hypothetical protein [Chlamydiales bacterium]